MAIEEIVHPQDISNEMLQALFESAYMETYYSSDGTLRVTDDYSFWVSPVSEGQRVQLWTLSKFNPESSLSDRLIFVNKINNELALIRAFVNAHGVFVLDYDIPILGGITKRAIVLTAKFFENVLRSVLQKDEHNILRL